MRANSKQTNQQRKANRKPHLSNWDDFLLYWLWLNSQLRPSKWSYNYRTNVMGRGSQMKKSNVAKNLSVRDVQNFSQLYDEISSDWELKAERLQNRRWRELRRKLI